MRVIHHPCADHCEESGEAQIRHHDHHAEQQDDGVVIDGGVCFLNGEDVEGKHQAGADDGRAGSIHPQKRNAPDGKNQVRGGENEDCGQQAPIVSSGRIDWPL